MELLYKGDWEEAKKRYTAWWAHEVVDRCVIAVTAPKDGINKNELAPQAPSDPIEKLTNLDYISKCNEYNHSRTFFGGEAFPIWSSAYPGHTTMRTFLGCPIHFGAGTAWHEPILNDDDWDIHQLRIDKESYWWQFTIELVKKAAEQCKGNSIPSIPALSGCGDTLSTLRGNDKLLLDVLDFPERILDAEMYLMDIWIEVYSTFYDLIKESGEGSTAHIPLWSPERYYFTQCDFSYMISPTMFQKMFLPAIEKQTEFLGHSIHHLDGVDAFRHLPALCELPRLQAIQVRPGTGKPNALHYMDTLKIAQAAGKNIWIQIPSDEVEQTLIDLSAKGLFIYTSCETEDEARDLLEKVNKWSHD